MGQKVHPIGMRLGITKKHTSTWYAEGQTYADNLYDDLKVRKHLYRRLTNASVSRIDIERLGSDRKAKVRIKIHTARPGYIIGKKGEDLERLREEINRIVESQVDVRIVEIRKPDLDAKLVADSVAQQLERRVMFRRAMKRAVQNSMRQGAGGVRLQISGRLGGAEIARTEWYREGRVPLHTLRADIDYATAEAHTTYGVIGVKVWIFKGEVFDLEQAAHPAD